MANYEEKFIVINKKHLELLPGNELVLLHEALRASVPYLPENKYLVCNQDEPYAGEILKTILSGEEELGR